MVCIVPCAKCVSGYHITASQHLAMISEDLKVDGRIVPHQEIVDSERPLAFLSARQCRDGFPYRTPQQVRAEIFRLADKYERKVTNGPFHKTEADRASCADSYLWVYSSDDSDDFMPSEKERRAEASRKGKNKKAEASRQGKNKKAEASSKGKGKKAESSSKGKSANAVDGAGCVDGR